MAATKSRELTRNAYGGASLDQVNRQKNREARSPALHSKQYVPLGRAGDNLAVGVNHATGNNRCSDAALERLTMPRGVARFAETVFRVVHPGFIWIENADICGRSDGQGSCRKFEKFGRLSGQEVDDDR